ncbi:hypothetical protein N781_02995 [Pontibacillus halophilus JSM 076056 = DSM 19796]|uniref:S1 motif domain-containing protein n=1 Tax=Pontibacillus halophilus JSM 076056 = DSM 19796 TaxID=1385510 RepID=A0A0A5I870_9BACI|nr:S1-like domain-containing RNA-binding protein [Pontibacillus halophilus]KGX92007.1 hypothetical protein N781_02995 [Pontibacillus halophilus JSM 076056 = DSM 19796]
MKDTQVGTIKVCNVLRQIETGYVLGLGDEEVLLHHNEAEHELENGEEVEVFLYHNKRGDLVGTMNIPSVTTDDYNWVSVKEVVPRLGVFVDIGTVKDILVSEDDLPLFETLWPQPGDEVFVRLITDKKGRLLAKPATETVMEDYFETAPKELLHKSVSGRIYRSTQIGSFLVTEDGYRGFIHHLERKEEPRFGEWMTARVIDVKEDGSLNLSLRPVKEEALGKDAEEILAYLKEEGGKMRFTDKSDPDAIRDEFQISKAAFKRALGRLMKDKRIQQKDGMTYLLDE